MKFGPENEDDWRLVFKASNTDSLKRTYRNQRQLSEINLLPYYIQAARRVTSRVTVSAACLLFLN